jgi:type I restriction enzyme S subunit
MTISESQDQPAGWSVASGSELFSLLRGVTFKKKDAYGEKAHGRTAILRAGNIQEGELLFDDLVYVPSSYVKPQQLLNKGDLVVAMSSGSARIVGKAAHVTKNYSEVSFGAFCGLARPHSEEVAGWLRHYFQTSEYREAVSAAAAGININNLKPANLTELRIPVPPVHEQRRIVASLEALQQRARRAREALDAIPPLLERFRQSVLAAAFCGELTADWRVQNPDVEPASVLLERIREERRRRWEEAELAKMAVKGKEPSDDRWKSRYSEPPKVAEKQKLHELPRGWCWAKIGEVSEFVTSGSRGWGKYYSKAGALFIRVGDFNRYSIDLDLSNAEHVDPPSGSEGVRTAIEGGDLLLSITADLGMVAVAPADLGPAYVNQHVALMRLLPGVNSKAVAYSLLDPKGFQKLARESQYGMTKAGLSLIQVRSFAIPLLPAAEQEEVSARLGAALNWIASIEELVSQARSLYAGLDNAILAKAFRGELVPQDPNDEPASVLLERIRASRSDKPARGRSRKQPAKEEKRTLRNARDYTGDDWRRALLECLGDDDADIDDAIEAAAIWAAENQGLEFERLRRDGLIVRGLEAALERAVQAGEVERLGPSTIRKIRS